MVNSPSKMATQYQPSALSDPLAGYSGPSLFHRSLSSLSKPPELHCQGDDLEITHNYLKSLALRSPNKLLEQAKSVIYRGSEVINSEMLTDMVSKNKTEVPAGKGTENQKERRPGFGRKQARFSLRPETSQAADTANFETSLDIDKFPEPEEFFLAFERMENAKKEIQKHLGGDSVESNQEDTHTRARPRRQGILGRSVNYKHLYQSKIAEKELNISSRETVAKDGLNSSLEGSLHTKKKLQETESAGSIANAEERVSNLLDELLSQNDEDLDGDAAVTLLQERLQLKPVRVENLSLPELTDVQRNSLKASRGNLAKRKSNFPDMGNVFKSIRSTISVKHRQEAESSVQNTDSSTPSKSPLASMALLTRRAVRSSPLNDPFSAQDLDQAPASSFFLQETENKSDQVGIRVGRSSCKESELSGMEKHASLAADATPGEMAAKELSFQSSRDLNGTSARLVIGNGLQAVDVETNNGACNLEGNVCDTVSRRSKDYQNNRTSGSTEANNEASRGNLAKRKSILAGMGNIFKRISSAISVRHGQEAESSVQNTNSSIPSESPLASMSLSIRCAARSIPVNDPFSAQAFDQAPASSSVLQEIEKESNHVGIRVGMSRGRESELSGMEKDVNLATDATPVEIAAEELSFRSDRDLNGISAGLVIDNGLRDADMETDNVACDSDGNFRDTEPVRPESDLNDRTHGCTEANNEKSHRGSKTDRSDRTNGYSEANNDKTLEASSELQHEQQNRKVRPQKGSRREHISRRQSLAAAGTSWNDGVRRSTRIRTKPLQYWKGERLLYGRIHGSLVTVIGRKYVSSEGTPALKVESFVSDKYKDLVEKAALH